MATRTTEAKRVEHFNARLTEPQIWYDSWRNRDRIIRYKGRCYNDLCGKRTFGADDGENDPRGVLGDFASSPLCAEDYGMVGEDIPMCYPCSDEEGTYKRVLEHVRRHVWKYPDDPEVAEIED